MELEPSQAHEIFGPLVTEQALSDIPLFGPQKSDVETLVEEALADSSAEEQLAAERLGDCHTTSALFENASSLADKLKALRLASKQGKEEPEDALLSQLDRHEKMLLDTREMTGLSSKERFAVDHTMLIRAYEGYRFDFAKNQKIVADDPWLRDVWVWVEGKLSGGNVPLCPLAKCSLDRRRGCCSWWRDDVAPPRYRLHGCPLRVDEQSRSVGRTGIPSTHRLTRYREQTPDETLGGRGAP